MGMTLASLKELWKTSLLKDRLISWDNCIDNCFLKPFKILVGILLDLQPYEAPSGLLDPALLQDPLVK